LFLKTVIEVTEQGAFRCARTAMQPEQYRGGSINTTNKQIKFCSLERQVFGTIDRDLYRCGRTLSTQAKQSKESQQMSNVAGVRDLSPAQFIGFH
jgi:hypothetical protein